MSEKYYTQGKLLSFIRTVFGSGHVTGHGKDIQVICPYCKRFKGNFYNKQKLSINLGEKFAGMCKCWVCGYKSKSLFHIIKKFHPEYLQNYIDNFAKSEDLLAKADRAVEKKEHKPVVLPDDFTLLATASGTDPRVNGARNYLKARGVDSLAMLWYWRLGISKASDKLLDRVIVPSFDQNGMLNYYSARSTKKNLSKFEPKYLNPESERENIIFNEININWNEELVLTEGVFDLIKCSDNATCILGTDLTGEFKLFQKIIENKTPVVLALDPEAKNKTFEIAKRLCEFDIKVRILELRPGQEDVGSLTKSEFNDLLETARIFDMKYLLQSKIMNISI